jgi:hypothetical protein
MIEVILGVSDENHVTVDSVTGVNHLGGTYNDLIDLIDSVEPLIALQVAVVVAYLMESYFGTEWRVSIPSLCTEFKSTIDVRKKEPEPLPEPPRVSRFDREDVV